MRILFCVLLLAASVAVAQPLARPLAQIESTGGVRIVLYDDPCELQDRVVNLPRRTVWTAGGRTFEGCWALSSFGIVEMYFDDKTVKAIPLQLFVAVRET